MNGFSETLILFTVLLQDLYSQEYSGRQSNFLENYRFIPKLAECYHLYTIDEAKATCRRETDLENQVCIQWISNNHTTSLGFTTPTNETVLFAFVSKIESKSCYEVYDTEQNLSIICQQTYEGHAVGIQTPDNFTIIFYNDLCKTATNISGRAVHSNFVSNVSIDVNARSCYKVYSQEEVVSPYNCPNQIIEHVCVKDVKGCTTLTTKNNEVLILDCPFDKNGKPKQKNCFYLYDSDNQLHTVCQERLEENCVGIITPSNLTVLFECFVDFDFNKPIYYNKRTQWRHRLFIKDYLRDEYWRNHPHYYFSPYQVFNDNLPDIIHPHWIPKTSCYGLTLESKETILLKCMVQNENQQKPGCFSLITKDNEKQSICIEVLNEICVGLKSPENVSVALACYGVGFRAIPDEILYFFFETFYNFIHNSYEKYFLHGFRYEAYKDEETTTYQVQTVKGQKNCSRLVSEFEIILLNCHVENREKGCFNVLDKTRDRNKAVSNSTNQVGKTCVKILNSTCIGIITPENWTLPLVCFGQKWALSPKAAKEVNLLVNNAILSYDSPPDLREKAYIQT